MVRDASLFCQLLQLIPRHEFHSLVRDVGTERHSKGFSSWTHFVSLLFLQFAQAKSLREICGGLASCQGKLSHLGLSEAPKRSTLAYANEHRSWHLYESLYYRVLRRLQAALPTPQQSRLYCKLYSMDASVIVLALSMFDWARYRSQKGAVKLHLLLDHDHFLPVYAHLTTGRHHDLEMAKHLALPRGSLVVFDRGYQSFQLFGSWTQQGVFWVTRLKSTITYEVVERCSVAGEIVGNEIIELTHPRSHLDCPYRLRRVVKRDAASGKEWVFLTNHLGLTAEEVAEIYKQRWQIETFFKAIKQNLRIKTFVGTSANAVQCQFWTAMLTILLLKFLRLRSRIGWALSNLVAYLRWNLFAHRDLWIWLDDPFGDQERDPPAAQLTLGF